MTTEDPKPEVVKSLLTHRTTKPPCCIAYLPRRDAVFVVGCYELNERPKAPAPSQLSPQQAQTQQQRRSGSLELIRVSTTNYEPSKVTVLSIRDLDYGILDIRNVRTTYPAFNTFRACIDKRHALVAATSNGMIALIIRDENDRLLVPLTLRVAEPGEVLTQLQIVPGDTDLIAFTSSTGEVKLLQVGNCFSFAPGYQSNTPYWHATEMKEDESVEVDVRMFTRDVGKHSLEAWCVYFAPEGFKQLARYKYEATGGIWTGGDDARLAWQPIDELYGQPDFDGDAVPNPSSVSWEDSKIHGAGVTAILPIQLGESGQKLLITGSYDDRIRVLKPPDSHTLRRPQVLGNLDLGGGVWRLELLDEFQHETARGPAYVARLLVCCMYAGASIVELTGLDTESDWDIRVLSRFTEHESMCYGCASWVAKRKENDYQTMVTCSFYDKRVCVWRPGDARVYRPRNTFGLPGE